MTSRLQLLGITAMLIASKYHEIDSPVINDFIYMTDNAYTNKDVHVMEFEVLKLLEFYLNFATCHSFKQTYLSAIQSND